MCVTLSTQCTWASIGSDWHLQLLATHPVGSLWGSLRSECVVDSCTVVRDRAKPLADSRRTFLFDSKIGNHWPSENRFTDFNWSRWTNLLELRLVVVAHITWASQAVTCSFQLKIESFRSNITATNAKVGARLIRSPGSGSIYTKRKRNSHMPCHFVQCKCSLKRWRLSEGEWWA